MGAPPLPKSKGSSAPQIGMYQSPLPFIGSFIGLRNPKLQKKVINRGIDKATPVIQKVGSEAINQLSTKVRPNYKYKTHRIDLDADMYKGGTLKDLKKDEIYMEWEAIPSFLKENEKLITKDFARKAIKAWNNKKDFQGKITKKNSNKTKKKIMIIGWQVKVLTFTKQLVNYQNPKQVLLLESTNIWDHTTPLMSNLNTTQTPVKFSNGTYNHIIRWMK